jgi:FKBP-type peptidyl-prolyl cis-trans isomerase
VKGERLLLVASCVLATTLVSCGSGSESSAPSTGSSVAARTTPHHESAAQARRDAERQALEDRRRLERTFAPNPYRKPAAPPPHPHGNVRRLLVHDIERGHGPALAGDETVYVDFVKSYYRSGRVFLASWGPHRAEALRLELEAPGIERGMAGMRPGGRRTIVLPRGVIGDVHDPDGTGWEIAVMQVVLRSIARPDSGY